LDYGGIFPSGDASETRRTGGPTVDPVEGLQEGQDSEVDARSEHSPLDRLRSWRERIRSRRSTRHAYRLVIALLGGSIVVGGLLLVPLPGPGWLIVILGLAVLASEFAWARDLLDFVKRTLSKWTDWLGRQSWTVRGLVGLATFAFVAVVFYVLLWAGGVPGWMPDAVIERVPGLTP
jgi:uncharacterized protein (TIGR02611 family)